MEAVKKKQRFGEEQRVKIKRVTTNKICIVNQPIFMNSK